MSDHGHDAHDHSHDSHGHDSHGHDAHGHGHEEHWGDYNAEPLAPSNLPPVSPALLIAFGTALTFLMCMIVASSLMLASSREGRINAGEVHADSEHSEAPKKD